MILQIVVLSVALSRAPIRFTSEEREKDISFDSCANETLVLDRIFDTNTIASTEPRTFLVKDFPSVGRPKTLSTEERFRKLAHQWSEESAHISSVTRAVAQPAYQEIIGLGWDAVPLMLKGLQENKGFWFPALTAITGVRPFDLKDAGNSRRMTQAWIDWGRKKGLI